MTNAELILRTLDDYLDHPVRLILYGRAALQLGFPNPPPEVGLSKDVDGIIPPSDLPSLTEDENFWDAQEAANAKLRPQGLYITHLFRSEEIFLRPDWENHLVPIRSVPVRWLRLFRPAALDLILTKMMRGEDAQDMADVAFLIKQGGVAPEEVEAAIQQARLPDLAELREAFEKAKPRVLSIAREFHRGQ